MLILIFVFTVLPLFSYCQSVDQDQSKYSLSIIGGIPFYYANNKTGSENGRSFYLSMDKKVNQNLFIGVKPQFIQYYSADVINQYSYLNKHLDLTIQAKRRILNLKMLKLHIGGGVGISYSDYIPYARYYWNISGYQPGMLSRYVYEIQPVLDPMVDILIPINSSIQFQASGGIKTYFLNYAMKNTGLNYSNNDLFGLIYWGGGLNFKL